MPKVEVATIAEVAAAFGRALRVGGLAAPLSAVSSFAQALDEIGVDTPSGVFWAGHCSFVRRPEDTTTYAATFFTFFSGSVVLVPADAEGGLTLIDTGMGESSSEVRAVDEDASVHVLRYSPAEVLAHKDFAACSEEELREIARAMRSLVHRPAHRRSRRRTPTGRHHGTPDLRRTVRAAVRHGGETPPHLHRLGPGHKERPVVLLIDVSGSMDPYSRAYVDFADAAVAVRRHVEVFALGTQLTRITRTLTWRDPSRAIASAFGSVTDMSGGTRLGEVLGMFNDRYGVAGAARGALVVIFSDGWDRGDPEQIGREMGRLDRVAHRIVWVNPLKSTPGYAPLARGMAAALPHVGDFLEGHSLASLEELVRVMEQ